jgi:hypothetical protein
MIYDYIIIGAGVAGLYAAYNIKKNYPDKTFIILECNSKKYIGGRAREGFFSDHTVVTGAGIGRKNKDKYLISLLNELNIKYGEFAKEPRYSFEPVNLKKTTADLKVKFNELNRPRKTFKEFALPILGPEIYKKFVRTSGYTDFENDDAEHVLYMYGFDDNACCWTALSISWTELIKQLINKISLDNIKLNSKVIKIENNDTISVFTEKKEYNCKKLLVATTIQSLRKLFKNSIYKEIEGQSFIRIYGVVSKKYIPLMKEKINGSLIVDNEIHRIISYDPDYGLYMIAYSDNKDADYLKKHADDKEYLENLLKKTLKIEDIKLSKITSYYHKIGTHYYKPLSKNYDTRLEFIKKAQNPEKNIYVIGEVVSENQGWVNSAFDTFHKISKYL